MPDSQIKVELLDHMGTDLKVSNAARVSFRKRREEFLWRGDERIRPGGRSDDELIEDLAREGHYTPFGHNFATFHVKAPVFVARQLVKHEYLRMNEVSRRYVDDEPEFYTPDVWRGRAKDKKQGSDGVVDLGKLEDPFLGMYQQVLTYEWLLKKGVAPEQARMVLPQSMMTEWWWSGSMDAFANMVKLRNKPDAQYETRLVAQQVDKLLREVWPVSWGALVTDTRESEWKCPHNVEGCTKNCGSYGCYN